MKQLISIAIIICAIGIAGCNTPTITTATPVPTTSAPTQVPSSTEGATEAAVPTITSAPASTSTTESTTVATSAPGSTSAPPASATQPPVPSATNVPPTAAGGVATFTSQALGISFNYLSSLDGQTIGTLESGDKVYVYVGNMQPTQGQWVQVFQKPTNQSLENAIKAEVLKGYSTKDCLVVKTKDPVGGQKNPASYTFAQIEVPHSANDTMETLSEKAKKCPQTYVALGGIAYFLADSKHPDRFLFFSIGQYAILAGKNVTWQNTIKFLDIAPSGGTDSSTYLDDRSNAWTLMRSFVNALNRKEYVRAYSYWEPGATQLQPYPQFEQGYANTASVQLTLGAITSGAGAGQLYYSVPVTLIAKTTGGATQTFVGCYILHLGSPSAQGVPPFQPLAIQSAKVNQVPNNANTTQLMAQACEITGSGPVAEPTYNPSDISPARYLDDRSDPVEVLRSLFNAVNRKEYVRAYSYWEPGAQGLQPYPQFEQGYANTASVQLKTGTVGNDAGAGQFYFTVPVTLIAKTTGGATQTFVGCYTLHLSNPGIQGTPPFHPLGIRSANVKQVANNANTAQLMSQACP